MKYKQSIKLIISWGVVVLIAGFIFGFSNQTATNSGGLSKKITKVFYYILSGSLDVSFDTLHHYVRKLAHFTIYFLLGLSLINAFMVSNFKNYKIAFILSSLYAITDEVHQMFIPGRSAQVSDVLLDSFGALVGILFYKIIQKYILKESVKL